MGTMKVMTVAGGYVGDKGPANLAAIGGPYSSVYDNAGNLFISDFFRHRIRKGDAAGDNTTPAPTGIFGDNKGKTVFPPTTGGGPHTPALSPARDPQFFGLPP